MIKPAIACVAILSSLPAMAEPSCKVIEQNLDAAGIEHLDLDVHVGEVRIQPAADAKIHVKLTVCVRNSWFNRRRSTPDDAQLVVDRKADRLALQVNKNRYSEEWEISMPATMALSADMGVGEIGITGLRNDISLDLGVGDARIEGLASDYGHVSGDVGVGDMTVRVPDGNVENQRAVVSASSSWSSAGAASISADVGVGDAGITLN